MTTVISHQPRENNVRRTIQTMQNEKTSAANGSDSSGQSADSSRISNIFNVLLKSRTPAKSEQDKLIDSERAKRGLEKSLAIDHDKIERMATQLASKRPPKEASAPKPPRAPKQQAEKEPEMSEHEVNHYRQKYNVARIMAKSEPVNSGDKEKEKTEKPANQDKLMNCIKMAKQFKDPTVAYPSETAKVYADQQKKNDIGGVYGREEIKTTEPVKKSVDPQALLKLRQMAAKGVEIKPNGIKPNQPVNSLKAVKKSIDPQAKLKLSQMGKKGVSLIPSKGDKINPEVKKSETIRISQTKTENDLVKPLEKADKDLYPDVKIRSLNAARAGVDDTRAPRRGEITAQKVKEKETGNTPGARNKMAGNFSVVPGGKVDAPKPVANYSMNQPSMKDARQAAIENNQRVDMGQYKKADISPERASRQARIESGHLQAAKPDKFINDFDRNLQIRQQQNRQEERGMPVEQLRSQKFQPQVVPQEDPTTHFQEALKRYQDYTGHTNKDPNVWLGDFMSQAGYDAANKAGINLHNIEEVKAYLANPAGHQAKPVRSIAQSKIDPMDAKIARAKETGKYLTNERNKLR